MVPLNRLCYHGKLDEVRLALAQGGDVNDKDSGGQTALIRAVYRGHNLIVKLLLDQPGIKINEKTANGDNALHRAVTGDNPEGARILLSLPGMNLANSINNRGETPLMVAVKHRAKEVLQELVKHENISLDIGEGAMFTSR